MRGQANKKQVDVQINGCTKKDFEELGKALRTIRKNRNLSQNDLSEITLRDRTGISHYERGVTTPTLYALHDISEALNYDMEIRFKEVSKLNESIITEDYIKEFVKQRKDRTSFAHNVFSEIDGIDEEWCISKVNKNDVTVKNNNKYVRIFELANVEGKQSRFRPIMIQAGIEEDRCCQWRLYIDSKENGIDMIEATDFIGFIVNSYLLGNLISINDTLDDIFYEDIDILKLKGLLYDSYEILRKYYKLTDNEILEETTSLFGENIENVFIGLLKGSYESDISFDKNREIIFNEIKEALKNLFVNDEAIDIIVRIGYCIEFSNLCFQLENEEGFSRLGEHICIKKGYDPIEGEIGTYVIKSHVLDFIDRYLEVIDDRYSVDESIDILCDILFKFFGEITICEFEGYYEEYVLEQI